MRYLRPMGDPWNGAVVGMIHLYEYQQQALDAEARHRAERPDETRLAIVLPTGTGKGTILAERAGEGLNRFGPLAFGCPVKWRVLKVHK